jgi:hypothetical protein
MSSRGGMGHSDKERRPAHYRQGPKHETHNAPGDCDRKGGIGTAGMGPLRGGAKMAQDRGEEVFKQSGLSMAETESAEPGVEQACAGDCGAGRGKEVLLHTSVLHCNDKLHTCAYMVCTCAHVLQGWVH